MAGIYIHIPFCQSRCIYCDFYSTLHTEKGKEYLDALVREMQDRQQELSASARTYHTLYIGGGTPSTLSPNLLCRLLEKTCQLFPLEEGAELTLEANPDDVSPTWIEALKDTPINRISMGTQTFNDSLLRFINRRHDSRQAIHAVRLLQDAGYTNISIDLIYGIPGQTRSIWENDVRQALLLDVPHLSAYSMMYEEGTPLTHKRDRGEVEEMIEEDALWCYNHLCQSLSDAGYRHYEISNFARPGFHSRHNSSYWTGTPYLGFGPGAHSYDGERTRRSNKENLLHYIQQGPEVCTELLEDTDLYNEYVMTRLRTSEGMDLDYLRQHFGEARTTYCQQQALPHLQRGNLLQMGQHLCLSRQGIFISNEVISDLFL